MCVFENEGGIIGAEGKRRRDRHVKRAHTHRDLDFFACRTKQRFIQNKEGREKKKRNEKKKKDKKINRQVYFHCIWRQIEKNVRQGKLGSRDGETARVAYVALRYNIISLYLDEFFSGYVRT